MAGTVHKQVAAQVSRQVEDSFQRLRDAGMPARAVAMAFGPVVLAMVVKPGRPEHGKAFLALIRDAMTAEARQEGKKKKAAPLASRPTPPIVGTLDDLRNRGNDAKERIYRVIDLGFAPHVVLLSFGHFATQMIIEGEGYAAALAWLDELSEMIDLYPRECL